MSDVAQDRAKHYDALCLDTCIYEAQGMSFDKGLLKQLEQFNDNPASLVVPDIVHQELLTHLKQDWEDAHVVIKKALRLASRAGVNEERVLRAKELLMHTDENAAAHRLDGLYRRCNAKRIASASEVMPKLVEMYFAATPPFERTGTKKSEFPDAIALLSLEAWAEANDYQVLVVSNDGGWLDFCARSKRLDTAEGLGEALAHFQPLSLAATIIRELQDEILCDGATSREIGAEIRQAVERQQVTVEASSSYSMDERYADAAYLSHEYAIDSEFRPIVRPIRVHAHGVVLQLSATVDCEVTAEYALSVFDSIDREYVPLRTVKRSAKTTFDVDVILSLVGDFRRGLSRIKVQDIEVEGEMYIIELGDIDPDPDNDEWQEEKFS